MPENPAYPQITPPGNAGRGLRGCYDFEVSLQRVYRKPNSLRSENGFVGYQMCYGRFCAMKQEKEAIRTGIYIDREILNRADEAMGKTNARSRSEFISEALEFYIAWLHSGEISKVLTPALESVISGQIKDTENRISRVIFKQSVELAMLMHVVAATHAVRPEDLEALRKMCVSEVSKVNGRFHFDDAVRLQNR